ncbi:MAG: cysteine--tRNA ligase [Actinobacteria bacterium]|nr:cysteine--tRNA ligase [Actinomycetota bacterium]
MRLYSTLQRGLVELPEPPGPIGMYVCGPTVYARAHIGNARPYVVGSWYARWLRLRGYGVTLVHNITDVNDKIYEAAPGASAALATQATEWYLEDVCRFGLDEVDHYPRATETVDEIIAFIGDLIERGFAYAAEGDVYFRVGRFPEYGRLSRQRPDEVEEQEPNPLKEDPRDFALWKANKPDEDTAWDAPWGRGRPGWHIECSAMAELLLGPSFEIHGGGLDLVFPHHENELAQSRARGHEFARIWMHNGMLRFTGEKMAKSAGNVATIEEVLDEWGSETALVFFLTARWSSPIDFSAETMESARARADGIREIFRNPSEPAPEDAWERFEATLDDDFNTPDALALVHEWRDHDLVRRALGVFGLASLAREEEAPAEIDELARRRQRARASRDFAEADRLRSEIDAAGWEVRDDPDGYRLVPKQ